MSIIKHFTFAIALCLVLSSYGTSYESMAKCKTSIIVESRIGGEVDFGEYAPEEEMITPDDINQPRVITLDGKDNLYIADPVNYRVLKFNQAGKLLLIITLKKPDRTTPTSYGNDIKDMAVDKFDNLYLINYYQYRIEVYGTDGRLLTSIDYSKDELNDKNDQDISALFRPDHIQVDYDGNIYIHRDLGTDYPKGGIFSKDGRLIDRLTRRGVVLSTRIITDKIIQGKIVNERMVGFSKYYTTYEGKNQSQLILRDLMGTEIRRCAVAVEPTTRDFVDSKGNVYFFEFNKARILKATMVEK